MSCTTYIENGVSGEDCFANQVSNVVWCMPGKVHDAARQLPELELFVVVEVAVERLLKRSWVVQAVDRRERLLHLFDPPPNTDGDVTTELLFDVLGCGKVICVRVGFAAIPVVSTSEACDDRRGGLQNTTDVQTLRLDECKQPIRGLRIHGACVGIVV